MIGKFFHNLIGHTRTILNHKKLVRHLCFKAGLYRQGIVHDWSKYSPVEFITGIKYYQDGKRSPNGAEIMDKGYSKAWLHHQGRNKHHFEYWIDIDPENPGQFRGAKMDTRYVIEMFCDRVAASKNYHPDSYTNDHPWEYYAAHKGRYTMHPDTEKLLAYLLKMLQVKGEDYTFNYIRTKILKNKSGIRKFRYIF